MKKKTTSIIASAILLLAGIQTASAAVVPCLGQYTTYEPNPTVAGVSHHLNDDGTIHLAAYSIAGFSSVDVHTSYTYYYADGHSVVMASQWEYDTHFQRGIVADVAPCSSLIQVTMEVTVYKHLQTVVPIGYARIVVTPPTPPTP